MTDIARSSSFLGRATNMIGSKSTDLVLETLGKVYIKLGNSSKCLTDLFLSVDNLNNKDYTPVIILEKGLLIPLVPYPGDAKFVYDPFVGILYITLGELYLPIVVSGSEDAYVKKVGDIMTGLLVMLLEDNSRSPFIINSKQLVTNLNAEYLNGVGIKDFLLRSRSENISLPWTFRDLTTDKLIIKDYAGSPDFRYGLDGYGWRMDTRDSTLTLDNLVVRKAIKMKEEILKKIYDSKILATNGNIWSKPNNIKITNVLDIYTSEELKVIITTTLGERNHYWVDISGEPLMGGYTELGQEIPGEYKIQLNKSVKDLNTFYDYFLGEYYQLQFEEYNFKPRVNQVYRCLCINNSEIRYYDLVVTSVNGDNLITVRLSTTVNDIYLLKNGEKEKNLLSKLIVEQLPEGGVEEVEPITIATPIIGDVLVLIADIDNGITGMYNASIDDDSPAINIYESCMTPDYLVTSNLLTRVGNLSNILHFMQPRGYGLYCLNPYILSGDWYIANGVIAHTSGFGLQPGGSLESPLPSWNPFGPNITRYIEEVIHKPIYEAIAAVQNRCTASENKIQALEDTSATHLNKIVALENISVNLLTAITDLLTTITTLATTIAALLLSLTALEARVTALEAKHPV